MSDTQDPQSAKETPILPDEPRSPTGTTSQPDELAPPLVGLIASIRAAVARDASADARASGATACRSILAVLEAKPGQPLAAAAQPTSPISPASPLTTLLSQPGLLSKLAAMSRDELIGLLKQITGAMPARPSAPTTAAPRFHLIQVPSVRRTDGDR